MFDISFGQLLLVLVIGLVVLGPQKLPIAIKTVAGWIKALRRVSATVQLELNQELRLQELQDSLKLAEKAGLKDISPELQASIDHLKRVTQTMQDEINGINPLNSEPISSAPISATPKEAEPEPEPEPEPKSDSPSSTPISVLSTSTEKNKSPMELDKP